MNILRIHFRVPGLGMDLIVKYELKRPRLPGTSAKSSGKIRKGMVRTADNPSEECRKPDPHSHGKTLWNRNIGIKPGRSSIIEIQNDELIVASSRVTKLDANGTIIWQRSLENEKFGEIYSMIALNNGLGYIANSFSSKVYKIQLNQDGFSTNTSLISDNGLFVERPLYKFPSGYSNIYSDTKLGMSVMQFDDNGTLIKKISD